MSLVTIGGGLPSGGLFNLTPSSPAVLQDRVIASHHHSLYEHGNPYRNVPTWLDRMMDAATDQSLLAQGTFDTLFNDDPPNLSRPDPNNAWLATTAGANYGGSQSWGNLDSTGFTDLISLCENFNDPPALNGGGVAIESSTIPDTFSDIITTWDANVDEDLLFWIYEVWPAGNSFFVTDTGAELYGGAFDDWVLRAYNDSQGWSTWFDDYLDIVKTDNPTLADRIGLIPVSRAMSDVMQNTAASSLGSTDWFEDRAPHGTATLYVLASMIVYTTLMRQQAPTPSFTGATINSTFQTNYTSIAARIYAKIPNGVWVP